MKMWIQATIVVLGLSLLAGWADSMGDSGHWLDNYQQQQQTNAIRAQTYELQRQRQQAEHSRQMDQLDRWLDRRKASEAYQVWDGRTRPLE